MRARVSCLECSWQANANGSQRVAAALLRMQERTSPARPPIAPNHSGRVG